MIQEHQTIDLFGHMLFEKAVITPPFKRENPMPDEACFLYVLDGTLNSISEQEALLVHRDEAVLLKCGNYLAQMLATRENKRYEALAVHFYPDVLKKVYNDALPSFLREGSYTFSKNMVKVEASILIQKYIESLLFYFENPGLVTEDILILKLKEIVLLLLQTENAPGILEVFSNLFNPRTFSFKEVVEAHIFSSITIPELAALTNHSLSTFKREFAKIYNDSPARYRTRQRIERAKQLLKVSNDSVGAIAFETGFSDTAHFSRVFKSIVGISPTAYKLDHSVNKLDES